MTSDPALQEYKSVIERLKPVIGQPDFDQVLNTIASDVPKPKRFLIKMELKRMSAPCQRMIDLRGHVDGEVREFEHEGKLHHLDDIAIRVFKRGLKTYGKFTVGTYEEILNADNNFRVMHKNNTAKRITGKDKTEEKVKSMETATKTFYPGKAIIFGNRGFRCEERMIYAMAVDVELPFAGKIRAVTTDLSVSGCKLKLPGNYRVAKGQIIRLEFRGLEEEYSLGLSEAVEYEVVGVDEKSGALYPRCKRTFNNEVTAFDDFLHRFINGNKRRYKINLDNTVEAVITKGYEQFYLPRVTSLPIFVRQFDDGTLLPAMTLTTDNNRHIIRHWLDESNKVNLGAVLTNRRLQHILKKPGRVKETTLYAFTHHSKGRVYFYSATIDELNVKPEVKDLFLGFGANKSHFYTYKLQLVDCHPELSHIPLTLPKTASKEAEKLNKPPSARVMSHIEEIKYVCVLTDITDETSKSQYSELTFGMDQVNLLKAFGHNKKLQPPRIEEVPIKFVNLRTETRFIYKTELIVTSNLFEKVAYTRDFSTRGMQIEFEEPVQLDKDDIVRLAMPEMQKITKRFKLKNMPYEVVGVSKNNHVVNLQLFEEKGVEHVGKIFLAELVEKNRSKLKAAKQNATMPGLAEALRNIYVQRVLNTAMYIHKEGIKHSLHTIGCSMMPNPVVELLEHTDERGDYNLYPFLRNNYLNTLIIATLRKMQRQSRPEFKDLFIRVKESETDVFVRIESQLSEEFRNQAAQKIFIQKSSQKNTTFFCLRIFLSRTGRPDTDFIAKELAYVSQYAIHRAKVLENELWSVAGIADIVDITEDVMNRFKFPPPLIKQQMQKRLPNH